MSECKKVQEFFMDGLYAHLCLEKNQVLEAHLRQCEKCASEYSGMAGILQVMDQRLRPEHDPSFWEGYWDRLTSKFHEEELFSSSVKPRGSRLVRLLSKPPRWALQSAAALLILIIGMYLGKTIFISNDHLDKRSQTYHELGPPTLEQEELMTRANNYVERSKRIFLAIVNFDPEKEDPYALDLAYKQQISRDLIQEAAYLKSELAVSHQNRLRNLVAELERVLLQIANLESEHDLDSIELIKTGVDRQGLLLKIHLSDMKEAKRGSKPSMPLDEKNNFGSF